MNSNYGNVEQGMENVKDQHIIQLKKQIEDLNSANNQLKNQNYEYFKMVQDQQKVIQQQTEQIKQLNGENNRIHFEYKLSQANVKNMQDELLSLRSQSSAYSSVTTTTNWKQQQHSTLQPTQSYKKKKIFEPRTTLHMNHISPKICETESLSPEQPDQLKRANSQLQQIVVQEVQVCDYHDVDMHSSSKVEQIISKYTKQPLGDKSSEFQPQPDIDIEIEIKNKTKLFEAFLIISATKQNLYENHNDNFDFVVTPEILFSHPSEVDETLENQIKLLPQYLYPYGLQVKLEEKTSSLSNLNSILMGGQSYDRLSGAFVIPMKSDLSFIEREQLRKSCILRCNMTQLKDLLEVSNTDHKLYCVCVEVPDFYDYNIVQNPDMTTQTSKSSRYQMKRYFYSLSKTYCFITKIPLLDFFIETIKIIINTLKYKKAEIYSQYFEIEETLLGIDNTFYTSFKPELFQLLSSLQNLTSLDQFENFNFLQTPIPKPSIITKRPQLIEIEWAVCYTFSHITLPHYIMLLICLIQEFNICIICANRTLLSSILMVLPHSIAPFQFIHPIIFSLTYQLLPILDSPVPFLCGMLRDKETQLQSLGIDDEDLFFHHQNHVVFFDSEKLRFYNLPEDFSKSKVYEGLFYELFESYQQISNQVVPGHFLAENNEQTINLGLEVITKTQSYIETHIIKPISQEFQDLQLVCENLQEKQQDDIILKVSKTQHFAYYFQRNPNKQ